MKATILLLGILLGLQCLNAQQYFSYTDIQYDTIPGVDPNLLSLDIYKPASDTGLLPVVAYLHGGSWRAGDKDNVALKPEFFTGQGYVFISVNYRLSPNPPDTTLANAVRFPEHPRNVAKAMAWIYNNVHLYNGDKNKIGITGHSAGGHIAAVVASNPDFLDAHGVPNQIPCVCMFDAAAYNIPRLIAFNNLYSASIKNAMGTDPELWDDASPALQVRNHPGLGEWVLFSQEAGSTLYAEAVLMRDTFAQNGYDVPHYPLALEHDELNGYVGVQDSAVFQQLLDDNPFIMPSPNAYAIARAYTDSVQSFFQRCFSRITTSSSEVRPELEWHIYPNPVLDVLHISTESSGFDGIVTIFNAIGQVAYSGRRSGALFQVETEYLKSGIYFIQLKGKQGQVTTKKFIK